MFLFGIESLCSYNKKDIGKKEIYCRKKAAVVAAFLLCWIIHKSEFKDRYT